MKTFKQCPGCDGYECGAVCRYPGVAQFVSDNRAVDSRQEHLSACEDFEICICSDIRQQGDIVTKLTKALKFAQEALAWHEGMNFEIDGQRVESAIADALASASRYEARK